MAALPYADADKTLKQSPAMQKVLAGSPSAVSTFLSCPQPLYLVNEISLKRML
ncbi:hypothetical protein COLO4_10899 [Corchorus olitorius]|uniref:Uncharacterized protein n=1 Tax=Corchorus olitorius TaxID=93759 RepID=A0A1R3K6G9_9ROSI|nr:hypothetical protein COLO4_10899 [Corchorus olitorius]